MALSPEVVETVGRLTDELHARLRARGVVLLDLGLEGGHPVVRLGAPPGVGAADLAAAVADATRAVRDILAFGSARPVRLAGLSVEG